MDMYMDAMIDSSCLWKPDEQVKLVSLAPDTFEYLQVMFLLDSGWSNYKKTRPRLIRVLKIIRSSHSDEAYFIYQQIVHLQHIPPILLTDGSRFDLNESLLFHGTTRACLLGEDETHDDICLSPCCSLCRIIQSSFDIKNCGSNCQFSRFGRGIYTSICSSKADDYCKPTHPDAKKRFLLLNRVMVGREFQTKESLTHLLQAPSGFHSVSGEPGGDLNYEETVVYNNDAIRPAYLAIYELEED
ncbi:hypothetical protein DFH11DRAFT_467559 [Phellopilus nigrolimitatus]|nr:hypothetical protein DFH11DRAFT_467559 [Phellopilus nigrolimitatus]